MIMMQKGRIAKLAVLFVALTTLIATPTAFAQGDFLWVNVTGGTGKATGTGIAVDALGIITVTGSFSNVVDFGGGDITSVGSSDLFVAQYDSTGNHIWSHGFGGTGGDFGNGIAVDALGNVTVTGYFEGIVDFGGGDITSVGSSDVFVAQYDSRGTHVWSYGFGGTGFDHGNAVSVDVLGNVTVTGFFQKMIDFGGGEIIAGVQGDMFVAQFDSGGIHVWSRGFGGPDIVKGLGVAADTLGNVVVTGEFWGTADFGGGAMTSAGFKDVFFAQYDALGDHVLSRRLGGASKDAGHGIAVDALGNVTITGFFNNAVDFGDGNIVFAHSDDIFIAQYDKDGLYNWSYARSRTSIGGGQGNSIVVDALGNVVITGNFGNTVDFGGGVISGNFPAAFVVQFDSAGNHIWSSGIGGGDAVQSSGITVDARGNVTATGGFSNTVDFGGGPITSTGGSLFVVQYTGDPALAGGGRGGGGGGGCFIASATYGTPMAGEIDALRAVRDAYLLDTVLGSAFVDTYYRKSPPIADVVSRSPVLQSLVRVLLTPIVMLSKGVLATPGLAVAIASVALMLTIVARLYAFPRRSAGAAAR